MAYCDPPLVFNSADMHHDVFPGKEPMFAPPYAVSTVMSWCDKEENLVEHYSPIAIYQKPPEKISIAGITFSWAGEDFDWPSHENCFRRVYWHPMKISFAEAKKKMEYVPAWTKDEEEKWRSVVCGDDPKTIYKTKVEQPSILLTKVSFAGVDFGISTAFKSRFSTEIGCNVFEVSSLVAIPIPRTVSKLSVKCATCEGKITLEEFNNVVPLGIPTFSVDRDRPPGVYMQRFVQVNE